MRLRPRDDRRVDAAGAVSSTICELAIAGDEIEDLVDPRARDVGAQRAGPADIGMSGSARRAAECRRFQRRAPARRAVRSSRSMKSGSLAFLSISGFGRNEIE